MAKKNNTLYKFTHFKSILDVFLISLTPNSTKIIINIKKALKKKN